MCPDAEALSAYMDGELPGVWTGTVRSHIRGCQHCQRRLSRLSDVSRRLAETGTPEPEGAAGRVWKRLEASKPIIDEAAPPVWRRSVAVPVPVAALAAVLLAALGIGFLLTFTSESPVLRTMRITTEPSGVTEVQVSAPIQDLELILQSLERHDSQRETTIQLPEDSQFVLGEPILLREKEARRSIYR